MSPSLPRRRCVVVTQVAPHTLSNVDFTTQLAQHRLHNIGGTTNGCAIRVAQHRLHHIQPPRRFSDLEREQTLPPGVIPPFR
eukprot:9463206-Pyramimonas_sp.AAC.1